MKYGYVRTVPNHLDWENALVQEVKKMGAEEVLVDHKCAGRMLAPQMEALLEKLQQGDVVYTHSVDRLCRDMPIADTVLTKIKEKGASVKFATVYGEKALEMMPATITESLRAIIEE